MYNVAIIGGGAAGLAASIFLARRGKTVLLCERLPRVGKKILSTGNGRCNISNVNIRPENYHGQNAAFALSALSAFSAEDTKNFFEGLGLPLIEGENGKLYPQSLQAGSVLDLMRLEIARLGVSETVDCFITSLSKKDGVFYLKSEDGRHFTAKTVLVTTGGRAAPSMGTDGAGYALLEKFGHTLIKPLPSLVQLKVDKPMRALKGVKHKGAASIFVDGKKMRETEGELLFTDYGVSGPPIFNLSRFASDGVAREKRVEVTLNLFPTLSEEEVLEMLRSRRAALPHLTGESFLYGLLPKLLGREILKISKNDREMAHLLHALPLKVTGVMPFSAAQVTAGGIATSEVNPKTMESRLASGLYLAGEVLDIDGDCGGFNLQWAWSSAFVAAQNLG